MSIIKTISEKWKAAPKITGFRNEVTLPNGETLSGCYVLCASGSATPSHNPLSGFEKNAGFPVNGNRQSFSNRNYERDKDAQDITRNIAARYDSRAIQSPVIVSRDGVVLSGNGRTMAGELAAENGTDGVYIEHLCKFPQQFGFTPEQVQTFEHPRVLFVLDEVLPYNAATFAMFNAQEMKGQSKTEQAVKLGKLVDDQTFGRIISLINGFETLAEFYTDTEAATEVLTDLRRIGVISAMQWPEMFDGETISAQGREILENTLIGKAFAGNGDTVRKVTEFRSVRKSVITALAEISNNIALSDYSLESELSDALALVYKARNSGYAYGDIVSGFARQFTMFADDATVADYRNATVLMLADMINSRQATRLKKVFTVYNYQAKESAAGQIDMFLGDVKTKQQILDEVNNILNHGTRQEQKEAITNAVEQRKAESVQQNGGACGGNSGDGRKRRKKRKKRKQKKAEVIPQDEELDVDAILAEYSKYNFEDDEEESEEPEPETISSVLKKEYPYFWRFMLILVIIVILLSSYLISYTDLKFYDRWTITMICGGVLYGLYLGIFVKRDKNVTVEDGGYTLEKIMGALCGFFIIKSLKDKK